MSDELEPLPPLGGLARRALAAEQGRGDVDSAMQERVLSRVVASAGVAAAATIAAGTANAAAGAPAAGAGAAGTAGAAGAAGTTAGLTAKMLPWIVGAFVLGGGAGAGIHAAIVGASSSSPSTTMTEPARASPATPAAPLSTPSVATSAEPSSIATNAPAIPVTSLPAASNAAPPRPASQGSASATTSANAGSDVDLAAERALVDRARTALGRGQSKDALDALDAHAARYPHGRLSEEREALAVDALARAGRTDAAIARAARFRAAYPNSVFGAVVDSAVAPR